VTEILKAEGPYGAEWEEFDDGSDDDDRRFDTGWVESGDNLRLEVKGWDAHEWAQDLRTEVYSDLIDADPAFAVKAMLKELGTREPDLAKKVRKAKLPKDVLADYAVTYFQDPDEGTELLKEAMGMLDYEGTQGEVLLELDRAALQALGVTKGRWWDGAPWRLIDLPEQELAYEGTLMRHCVGRHNMGYRDAVRRGETAIWSLRSRSNRPMLTFEIDLPRWNAAGAHPGERGRAIVQLKGKLNRRAGKDVPEQKALHWIFAQLGVDPRAVTDFAPIAGNPGTSFDSPWAPYYARTHARLLAW
jgi:hypothetical protein